MKSKPRFRIVDETGGKFLPAPAAALRRLEAAAVSDVAVARLVLGLFAALCGAEGRSDRKVFPGYRGGLVDCQKLPVKFQKDARSLVEWALRAGSHDLTALLHHTLKIEEAVRRIRMHSILGRQFRRRAKRLMQSHPELPKDKWRTGGTPFALLPELIGKPLTEGLVRRVASFGAGEIQIVRRQAPMNSAWTPGVLTIRLSDDGYTVDAITIAVSSPESTRGDKRPRRVEGELLDFFETGTEGVIWMIEDDRRLGYEALQVIEEGDQLTITDQLGNALWRGVIRCDKDVGWRRYPMNPEYGQQCALGHWVHWIQKGFQPDDWARYFIRPDYDRLRGILIRKRADAGDAQLGPAPGE